MHTSCGFYVPFFLFIKDVVSLHGLTKEIVSDHGSQFVILDQVMPGPANHPGSFYHLPSTNSPAERINQTLEQYLQCFSTYLQDNRVDLALFMEFAVIFCSLLLRKSLNFLLIWVPSKQFPRSTQTSEFSSSPTPNYSFGSGASETARIFEEEPRPI